MTAADRKELQELHAASTPEPWTYHDILLRIGGMTLEQLQTYDASPTPDEEFWKDAVDDFEPTHPEDGRFIVAAHAQVPGLLDLITSSVAALEVIQHDHRGEPRRANHGRRPQVEMRCYTCGSLHPCKTRQTAHDQLEKLVG